MSVALLLQCVYTQITREPKDKNFADNGVLRYTVNIETLKKMVVPYTKCHLVQPGLKEIARGGPCVLSSPIDRTML